MTKWQEYAGGQEKIKLNTEVLGLIKLIFLKGIHLTSIEG